MSTRLFHSSSVDDFRLTHSTYIHRCNVRPSCGPWVTVEGCGAQSQTISFAECKHTPLPGSTPPPSIEHPLIDSAEKTPLVTTSSSSESHPTSSQVKPLASRSSSTSLHASRIFWLDPFVLYSAGTPAFIAAQIERPSGRFHGILNMSYCLQSYHVRSCNDNRSVCNFFPRLDVEERKPPLPPSMPERHQIEGNP
nr:hypothetical protein Iba_chr04dCG11900 [Ipomoea batatas]